MKLNFTNSMNLKMHLFYRFVSNDHQNECRYSNDLPFIKAIQYDKIMYFSFQVSMEFCVKPSRFTVGTKNKLSF